MIFLDDVKSYNQGWKKPGFLKKNQPSGADPDPAQNLDSDPGGWGVLGQPKTYIPPCKILGTPMIDGVIFSCLF